MSRAGRISPTKHARCRRIARMAGAVAGAVLVLASVSAVSAEDAPGNLSRDPIRPPFANNHPGDPRNELNRRDYDGRYDPRGPYDPDRRKGNAISDRSRETVRSDDRPSAASEPRSSFRRGGIRRFGSD